MDENTLPLTSEAASDIVRGALALWGLESCESSIVRHNENLACRVTDPKNEAGSASGHKGATDSSGYLLRICLPKTSGWVGLQQDPDALMSELAWMEALRRDTGAALQKPVLSLAGKELESVTHPLTGKDIPCMLLTWLDGEMLNQKEPDAEGLAREFGRLQALFHSQARSWTPPAGFKRLVYDESMLIGSFPEFERGMKAGIIRAEDLSVVKEATDKIVEIMRSIPRTPDKWGMIHADWLGNLVVTPSRKLSPIDFSLSGFGYYLMDMGIALSNLKKPLREPYLEGYGTPLTEEAQYRISAFILMIIFISAGKNVFNPAWRDWFQTRRLPAIAQEYCRRFLRGESVLMEI